VAVGRRGGRGSSLRVGWATALVILVALAAAAPAAGVDRQFSERFSENDNGNITIAANTLLTCRDSDDRCAGARRGDALNNNVFDMVNVDVDDDPTTVNSSAADLEIPAGAEVLFAGLYWGSHSSASNDRRSTVEFRVPGADDYETIGPADVVLDTSSGNADRYQAFAEVTDDVTDPGRYWVADVATTVNQVDRHGGWALVVAYHLDTQPARNLTIFDGFITVNSSEEFSSQSIPVSGFETPPGSAPVRTTLGFITYEGDRGSDGDGATLDNRPLSDASNPADNFFNSTITRGAAHVDAKRPDYVNQLGFDANLVNAAGFIDNGATSAVIRVNTRRRTGETYFPGVITFATELFAPRIVSTKSVENLSNPGGPARPGDTLRYALSFDNDVPADEGDSALDFAVADTIPAGTTYVPGSLQIDGEIDPETDAPGDDQAEFDPSANRATFRVGDGADATVGGEIPPQGNATVFFDVTVDDVPDGTVIRNQASYDYTAGTLGTALRGDTNETTTPVAAVDVTIAKSRTPPGDLIAGSTATYQLEVSNIGSLATDGSTVTVSDTLPAGAFTSVASAAGDGWTCSGPPGLAITCTRTDVLGAGAAYPPITIMAQLADPLPPGGVANTAEVAGGGGTNPVNNSDTDLANGAARADLAVSKTAEPATVPSGTQVTYTIEVTNRGPSAAQGVTVNDPVDPGDYSDVVATTTQGTCDATVSCALGTLAAGATATVTVSATVDANATTLANTATISGGAGDPDPDNNSATTEILVPNTADLGVVKTDDPADPDHPTAGDTYTYTLSVDNSGPGIADNVVLTDRIPDLLTPTAIVAPGWDCNSPGPGEELLCTRPTLAPADGAVTITITGTLAPVGEATVISNTVAVSSDAVDPNPGRATDTVSNLILTAADLDLTKSGPASVRVGGVATFSLRLENRGPSVAADTTLTDRVPAGLRPVSVSAPECSITGRTIDCAFGDLAAGEVREVTVRARATEARAGETVTNTAEAASATPDPIPTSNEGVATLGIRRPRVAIHNRAEPRRVRPGQVFGYRITLVNEGDVVDRDLLVCDKLSKHQRLLAAPKAQVSNGRRACWRVQRITPGNSRVLRIVAQIKRSSPPGKQRNTVIMGKRRAHASVRVIGG
jgi:uncharacterized repeat protein (TIGR01451 family)